MRKAGVSSFRNIDHAGDFGGVWYWNRYPGLQCDNDAYCYLPMLEETGFMPSKKFTEGHEIREYAQSIAQQFELYENALFHTMVENFLGVNNHQRASFAEPVAAGSTHFYIAQTLLFKLAAKLLEQVHASLSPTACSGAYRDACLVGLTAGRQPPM